MAWVATAIIGAGVIGAGASIYSSGKAADAQKEATQTAANTQLGMYEKTRGDLAPYRDIGARAGTELESRLPFLTSPIDVTAELNNPDSVARHAYDFSMTQGLKATQNGAAARGLGVSGAALKGAAAFSTGLTDNTYKTLYDMENTNRTNAFNRLKALVDTGNNAAAGTGAAGSIAANGAASAQIGGGNAEAASYNQSGAAINKIANNVGGYAMYKGLYGGNNNSGGSPFSVNANEGDVFAG